MSKEIMNLKEIAEYLSFSQKKLYNLVKEEKIPFAKIGGQYRFVKEEIDLWLKEQIKKKKNQELINLSILDEIPDNFEKRLLFMGLLTKELLKYNIRPIIVGGNAVEFYTSGNYATGDIDIISMDYKKTDEILKNWGFEKKGRHWFSKKYDILVESPSDILNGSLEKVAEVELRGLKVYLIGIEDLIIDRLNAYVHWKSEEDGNWSKQLLSLNWDRIDWNYLEKRSKEEKTIDSLKKLKKLEVKNHEKI